MRAKKYLFFHFRKMNFKLFFRNVWIGAIKYSTEDIQMYIENIFLKTSIEMVRGRERKSRTEESKNS